jgi:hypothetical protein
MPRRVLLDSEAQSLMLGASAIEGLGLTEDALEKSPWTISTSMGGRNTLRASQRRNCLSNSTKMI